MRAAFLIVLLALVVGCSQPGPAAANATSGATPSPAPAASVCKLPVWWAEGTDIHGGLLSVPDGAFSDAGVLPLLPQTSNSLSSVQFYGGTYQSGSRTWLRLDRGLLSPDGTQYTYWDGDPSGARVHVLDLHSESDRVIYSGQTLYIPIAFESDWIYLVHGVQLRQGAFDKLYRLSPSGGVPQLVTGSDRHMNQWGWVLIADGAAWGVDSVAVGDSYHSSLYRLDLASGQVTQWLDGAADGVSWPLGVDSSHRVFIDGGNQLWRLDGPQRAVQLSDPGPISASLYPGGSSGFVTDSRGVWFGGKGGVWLYADGQAPRQFAAGPSTDDVWPAGACT
jgi:hypothetical protein